MNRKPDSSDMAHAAFLHVRITGNDIDDGRLDALLDLIEECDALDDVRELHYSADLCTEAEAQALWNMLQDRCGWTWRNLDDSEYRGHDYGHDSIDEDEHGVQGRGPDAADHETGRSFTITPTWTHNMRILITALQDGTAEGKRAAELELMNLARQLDALNNTKQDDSSTTPPGSATA